MTISLLKRTKRYRFEQRCNRQYRCIKCYAKAARVTVNEAAALWVDTGCAAKWARQN